MRMGRREKQRNGSAMVPVMVFGLGVLALMVALVLVFLGMGLLLQTSLGLEAAGVDTVKELRRRNAANLLTAMVEINKRKNLVRRLPTEAMVQRWVDHAKELDSVVAY